MRTGFYRTPAIGPRLPGKGFWSIMPGFPEKQHETHLPTLQSAPRAYPRLPRPHEDPWRPCRHQRPPRQGPQAPGCLIATRLPAQPALASCYVQRLKTRAQFEAAMAGGTISRTPHFVLHRCSLEAQSKPTGPEPTERRQALFVVADQPWIGAVVPKRWAKRAVTRNGIKRQIYSVSTAFEE